MRRTAWNRVLWMLTIAGIAATSIWAWADSSEARARGTFAAVENGFRHPPTNTTPPAWWHWLDDRVVFAAPHEPRRQSLDRPVPAPLWAESLPRTDYLLHQGQFVGDVLYFDDEATPLSDQLDRAIHADIPDGHGFDVLTARRLLAELSSRGGRLMTRSSRSYRLLYLGPRPAKMSMVVLGRLRNLIRNGAIVVGHSPVITPDDSPDGPAFRELAGAMWTAAASSSGATWGTGRVFSGSSVADVLRHIGVAKDVEYPAYDGTRLLSSHRTMAGAEVYFVANASDRHETIDVSFRVAGRRAELWDPASGGMTVAADVRIESGRTTLPMSIPRYGLTFVVFRE
jgi:hypothetical protein